MKKCRMVLWLWLCLMISAAKAEAAPQVLAGYVYLPNIRSAETLSEIDFQKLTHVNAAFAGIDEESLLPYLDEQTADRLEMIKEEIRRQQADCRVLLSVGGWGCRGFSLAAQDAEHRAAFAKECASLLTRYQLDGVDIDWEYPVNGAWGAIDTLGEADRQNYTELLRAIREEIGSESILTVAFAPQLSSLIEMKEVGEICNMIYLMAYDYDAFAHADLEVTKEVLPPWLEKVDPRKLILGVPFYSRSSTAEYNGLSYRDVKTLQEKNGWETSQEDSGDGIWTEKGRISFDTPEELRKKARWAKEAGLGGVMIWEMTQDNGSELLSALHSAQ